MKFLTFSLICVLSLAVFACQRDEGVQAGREDSPEGYQPRPAPVTPTPGEPGATGVTVDNEVKGELIRVSTSNKTIVIRLVNGMEQTVKYDDHTTVTGTNVPAKPKAGETPAEVQSAQLRALKPGAMLVIRYYGDPDNKTASSIYTSDEKMKK